MTFRAELLDEWAKIDYEKKSNKVVFIQIMKQIHYFIPE